MVRAIGVQAIEFRLYLLFSRRLLELCHEKWVFGVYAEQVSWLVCASVQCYEDLYCLSGHSAISANLGDRQKRPCQIRLLGYTVEPLLSSHPGEWPILAA